MKNLLKRLLRKINPFQAKTADTRHHTNCLYLYPKKTQEKILHALEKEYVVVHAQQDSTLLFQNQHNNNFAEVPGNSSGNFFGGQVSEETTRQYSSKFFGRKEYDNKNLE